MEVCAAGGSRRVTDTSAIIHCLTLAAQGFLGFNNRCQVWPTGFAASREQVVPPLKSKTAHGGHRNTLSLLEADGYEAYAPDFPGHGDSDKPSKEALGLIFLEHQPSPTIVNRRCRNSGSCKQSMLGMHLLYGGIADAC
jgi:hypothetical protein